MVRSRSLAALALVALAGTACASAGSTASEPTSSSTRAAAVPAGPVTHVQLALEDHSRPAVDPVAVRSTPTRSLPTELYLPPGTARRPLIVFAHGYDGDPGKFTQLFEHWAEAGFVVAAPRFPITYTGASAGPIARAGDLDRQPVDMRFVLDRVLTSRYVSRIDRTRIGAAGLSLGGGTTWGLITDRRFRDSRIRAAIVMDGSRFWFGDDTFVRNRVPVLVYHADRDYALGYQQARDTYARVAPPKYFVTIFEFAHAEPYEDSPNPADEMVRASSVSFWRAYLLGDASARTQIVPDATVPGVSKVERDVGR